MSSFADSIAQKLAEGRTPNRLIHEKSPYLLQHAFNPVDWHPWGEEAFATARRLNKPIFLSIGYSTCHWCHVMAHESFENDAIAALLNEYYVCIKVDREERPDVDKVYMTAVQAMTGHGGWPLSLWLTPEGKPFYGGTYFPPAARHGEPDFPGVLRQLHRAWQEQREQVITAGERILAALREHVSSAGGPAPEDMTALLRIAYAQLYRSYDERLGGFGQAPKFPRPAVFSFLLHHHVRTRENAARDMVLHTLRRMWAGGIYDHLGGGFHRYAVDAYWRVPHFEKMLYDQAQLVWSCLEAHQITHDPFFAQVAREVLDYVLRDLTDAEGGFYSAEDADSALDGNRPEHKREGAFYMWRWQEIVDLLGAADGEVFCHLYGISPAGNTINDPHGEFEDRNVLYAAYTTAEAAQRFQRPEAEMAALAARARSALLAARAQRPRPHRDDKVIVAWNGLMISACARAHQVLDEPRYLAAATRAADFVLTRNYAASTQTLKRRYREGEAKHPAHLDDYAFLTLGLLDLYEADFEIRWLRAAVALTETQIRLFHDARSGGFFDTSDEDEMLLLRTKEDYDGAEPSGNSVAVSNLLRLSHMLDRPAWRQLAEETISALAGRLQSSPQAMPQLLAAIDFSVGPVKQVILAGTPGAPDLQAMQRAIHKHFLPNKIVLLADGGEGQSYLAQHLAVLPSLVQQAGSATAYVCENYTCQLPTAEVQQLMRLLHPEDTAPEAAGG